jgi:uncharacterized protein (TIRG00374 family)
VSGEQPKNRLRPARPLRRAAGLLAGLVLAGLALWAVGPAAVVGTLSEARPDRVALAALLAAVALTAWAGSLWVVLRSLGVTIGAARACWLFLGTLFLNSVTPFGQLGGDLPSGYLLARDSRIRIEQGTAAITSVNTAHKLTGTVLGVLALFSLGGSDTLALRRALPIWMAGAILLGVVAVVGWRVRSRLVRLSVALIAPPVGAVSRVLPGVGRVDRRTVRSRVDGFRRSIERIATPRTAAAVLVFGATGGLAVSAVLWLVVLALGPSVPVAVAVAAVPIARLSGLSPTPGGLGAGVVTLGGVLVALSDIGTAQAGAAALLYRGIAFWLPLVPGGIVVGSVLSGRAGRPDRP